MATTVKMVCMVMSMAQVNMYVVNVFTLSEAFSTTLDLYLLIFPSVIHLILYTYLYPIGVLL